MAFIHPIIVASNVGIGTSIPEYPLHIIGDGYMSGTLTQGSDARFKTNIRPITSAMATLHALQGVRFERIESGQTQIGLIAQEVEEVLPEVVQTSSLSGEKGIAYANLVALLIEAIKELEARLPPV